MSADPRLAAARAAKAEHLRELVTAAEALLEERPANAIAALVIDHGASTQFRGGAYYLRLAGIGGSSTCNGPAVVRSWLNAARKALARTAVAS